MTVQDILAAASQLSQEERLQVAIRLLESLKESNSARQPKPELDQSWKADQHPLVRSLVGVIPADEQAQAPHIDYLKEKRGLYDLLSKPPLSRLDFEAESIKAPVRAVEL